MKKKHITKDHASFWDELCGTQLAKSLGISDNSKASLKKFDNWYLDYYPCRKNHIDFVGMRNKKVLEIGLCYGTVGQNSLGSEG